MRRLKRADPDPDQNISKPREPNHTSFQISQKGSTEMYIRMDSCDMFRMDTACSSLPSLFGGQGSWLSSAKNGALARSKHNVSIEQLLTIFKSRADV